jgi:hypothetical protein
VFTVFRSVDGRDAPGADSISICSSGDGSATNLTFL